MKRSTRIAGIAVLLMGALAAYAGIPPSEGGLKAPNDALVLPRAITIIDGGVMTNVDLVGARNANAFTIPNPNSSNIAVSVQCPDAGAWVYSDVQTVGPGTGVMVQAGGFWTTACAKETRVLQADGGMYVGCIVAMSPLSGASTAQCFFHTLRGTF